MHLIGNFIICWENAFSDNMEFFQYVGHFYNLNLGHLREKVKYCLTDFFCKGEGDTPKIRQKYFPQKGGRGQRLPIYAIFLKTKKEIFLHDTYSVALCSST